MNSDIQKATHIRSRIRDFVLYIAIGFAFVGVLIVVAETGVSQDAYIRWGGLFFMSSLLFGYFISNSGQFLRERKFWALTAVLFLVHLAGFIIVLSHVEEWRLTWFIGMSIEYPVLVFFEVAFRIPRNLRVNSSQLAGGADLNLGWPSILRCVIFTGCIPQESSDSLAHS